MKATFEVIILPVSDPEKSLRFYRDQVGFDLDVDYAPSPDFRVIQLTPPGSAASIQFGISRTDAPAGSVRGLYLVARPLPPWLRSGSRGLCELRRFPRSRRQHPGPARTWPPMTCTENVTGGIERDE